MAIAYTALAVKMVKEAFISQLFYFHARCAVRLNRESTSTELGPFLRVPGTILKQVIAPGGGETLCPAQMAVRLAADLRLSADGSAVRT